MQVLRLNLNSTTGDERYCNIYWLYEFTITAKEIRFTFDYDYLCAIRMDKLTKSFPRVKYHELVKRTQRSDKPLKGKNEYILN